MRLSPLRHPLVVLLCMTFVAACQSQPGDTVAGSAAARGEVIAPDRLVMPPPDAATYAALATRIQDGDFGGLAAYRRGWLAQPDARERLARMDELERQALQMFDQPLRMGAIGAALIDTYPASLTGHLASTAYYERVGASGDAERFRTRTRAIANAMGAKAMGATPAASAQNNGATTSNTTEQPLAVLTTGEGGAYLRYIGVTPLGAIYGAPRDRDLTVTVIGSEGADKPLRTTTFDLSDAYRARRAPLPGGRQASGKQTSSAAETRSHALQRYLDERGREGDSAARTFLAMSMLQSDDQQLRGFARSLLQQAVSDDNLYARLLLVQALLPDLERASDGQRAAVATAIVRELEKAVAAGSEVAMLQLGRIQISDLLGAEGAAERRVTGLANVRRSADLNHVPAMLLLAGLYAEGGDVVAKDPAAALDWLARAGATGDATAQIAYTRYQLAQTPAVYDERAQGWMNALVEGEHVDAMFVVASLHARGQHLPRDLGRTRKLFRRIAELAPTAGEPINNVAWTLAVSDIAELRDPKRALTLMSRMMTENSEAAANPAYLDTWAATHAASGDFARAIEVQKQAITAAESDDDEETTKVLREHLAMFERGETITEAVP